MDRRGDFPLLGRDSEWETLRALVADVPSGVGGVIVIEGEAGIGKTRLVDEVAAAARPTCNVLRAAADELERDRPFGVIASVLGLDGRDPPSSEAAELASLLHGETDPLQASEGPALRYRIVDRAVDLVRGLVRQQPLLLVLEDVHWCDSSTLLTVHRLAALAYELPLVMVVTARPTPRPPELERVLTALTARGAVSLPLGPLSADATARLVEVVAEGRPDPLLLKEVERAAGNPLFVTELVRTLVHEGAIEVTNGQAVLEKRALPPSLRLTILAGLSSMTGETLASLRLASVLGSAFEPADLSVLANEPLAASVPKLREALDAGVLVAAGDRLAFRHALVREAIYEDLPQGVRKGLHRQVATAFAEAGRPAVDVAPHMGLGAVRGDREAVEWLRRAGREAGPRDPSIQVQLLERAADLLEPNDPERDELLAELLPALVWAGGLSEAEEVSRAVLARRPSPTVQIQVRRALAQGLHFQGRPTDAFEQAAQLVDAEDLSAAQQAHASVELAYHRLFLGDVSGAVAEAGRGREAAEELGDELAQWKALVILAVAAYFSGDVSEGVAFARRAIEAHDDLVARGQDEPGLWAFVVVLPLIDADELDPAARLVRKEWDRRQAIFQTASYHYFTAICRFVSGEWQQAGASCRSWLEISEETGLTWGAGAIYSILARLAVHADDLPEADRWIEVALRDFEARPRGGFDAYLVLWAQGFVAEAKGDHALAQVMLRAAWDVITQVQAVAHYRLVGPDYARVLLAAGDRDAARAVADHVEEAGRRAGEVASARGAALHVRALVEEDSDIALQAVHAFRGSPRAYELARACEDAARIVAQGGLRDEARALLYEAAELYERLPAQRDAVRTGAALRGLGVRGGRRRRRDESVTGWEALTETEKKVTALVVDGLTNPQIASRLYISRRTVDTHVRHIFVKLGVSSRVELATRATKRDG